MMNVGLYYVILYLIALRKTFETNLIRIFCEFANQATVHSSIAKNPLRLLGTVSSHSFGLAPS